MATITGKLESIEANATEQGSVVIALCGYGSQVPRLEGMAMFARVTMEDIETDSDGMFEAEVPGNDVIAPPGTYYTITVKNSNGDVVQTNAYLFLDDNDYHLENTPPFDPALPMMPLPPLIFNELLIVADSFAMNFDGTTYTAFKTTLHGDVTAATFTNMVPGNLYTFIIVQDGTGGWEFHWGANVHNGTMVKHKANAQTIQTFVADENGALHAVSAGAYQ